MAGNYSSIVSLRELPFSRQSNIDKLAIEELGPPRPNLNINQVSTKAGKTYNHRFSQSWYSNPGIFRGLVNLVASLDEVFEEHLRTATVFKGMSKMVQNKLLNCITSVINFFWRRLNRLDLWQSKQIKPQMSLHRPS
ncbi:hypothetical protein JOB18_001331 [Solea senegalensis]|uniref:Uncharacterized protein n=1 Tax=Solea senegalensis TaxID=28829 RepID=A0AAV6SJF4_SOLSE|nr:hypothetical protein JOB18_001331 [Solea senegalensis]